MRTSAARFSALLLASNLRKCSSSSSSQAGGTLYPLSSPSVVYSPSGRCCLTSGGGTNVASPGWAQSLLSICNSDTTSLQTSSIDLPFRKNDSRPVRKAVARKCEANAFSLLIKCMSFSSIGISFLGRSHTISSQFTSHDLYSLFSMRVC